MMKKISRREKSLFAILAIVVLIAAGFFTLYRPKMLSRAEVLGTSTFTVQGAGNLELNTERDMTVSIDTGGSTIVAVAVELTYPTNLLKLVSDAKVNNVGWNVYGNPVEGTPDDIPGKVSRMIGSSVGVTGQVPVFTMKFQAIGEGSDAIAFTKTSAAVSGTVETATQGTNATVNVFIKPSPPTVNIPRPITYKDVYNLSGTQSVNVKEVRVNNIPVALNTTNNTWAASINLNLGPNSIKVQGYDSLGNPSDPLDTTITRYRKADANNNGTVEILDFGVLMLGYEKPINDTNYLADFNESNAIGIDDFAELMLNWPR